MPAAFQGLTFDSLDSQGGDCGKSLPVSNTQVGVSAHDHGVQTMAIPKPQILKPTAPNRSLLRKSAQHDTCGFMITQIIGVQLFI